MKALYFIILLFICSPLFSQNYYLKGNEYFESGLFQQADSMYSLSICNFETHDAFFNRAFAKLQLGDTCSACDDLRLIGDNYLDKEAIQHFNTLCCIRTDTVYYDKDFLKSGIHDFRYYEIIRHEKYGSLIKGTLHKKNVEVPYCVVDVSCDRFGGFTQLKSNIIAHFAIIDGQRIYTLIWNSKPSTEKGHIEKDIKSRAKTLLSAKYAELKSMYHLDEIETGVQMMINEDGTNSGPLLIFTTPEITLGSREAEFKQDISEIVNRLPRFKPAKVNGSAVKYLYTWYLTF